MAVGNRGVFRKSNLDGIERKERRRHRPARARPRHRAHSERDAALAAPARPGTVVCGAWGARAQATALPRPPPPRAAPRGSAASQAGGAVT
eukprot:gene43938-49006_t